MKACYELQNVLFRETLYAFRRCSKALHEQGEWESEYDKAHAQFHALYTVIEDSLLENVYQEWKAKVIEKLGLADGQMLRDTEWELISKAINELNDEADRGDDDE